MQFFHEAPSIHVRSHPQRADAPEGPPQLSCLNRVSGWRRSSTSCAGSVPSFASSLRHGPNRGKTWSSSSCSSSRTSPTPPARLRRVGFHRPSSTAPLARRRKVPSPTATLSASCRSGCSLTSMLSHKCEERVGASDSRTSAANTARSAQSRRGFGVALRGTATS